MVAIQTQDLIGAALDWAVAKCENADTSIEHFIAMHSHYTYDHGTFDYSTNWSQGGPIIEREKIGLSQITDRCDELTWVASAFSVRRWGYGTTPLIAAMRCFVASKLGPTVEVPEELVP